MEVLSAWTGADEERFRALLSAEARRKLAWDGVERRSSYHQSTRALVGDLIRRNPKWPLVSSPVTSA